MDLDPLSERLAELALEGFLDLHHVTLGARHHNAYESLVVCAQTLHCLLQLARKVTRLVLYHLYCSADSTALGNQHP